MTETTAVAAVAVNPATLDAQQEKALIDAGLPVPAIKLAKEDPRVLKLRQADLIEKYHDPMLPPTFNELLGRPDSVDAIRKIVREELNVALALQASTAPKKSKAKSKAKKSKAKAKKN